MGEPAGAQRIAQRLHGAGLAQHAAQAGDRRQRARLGVAAHAAAPSSNSVTAARTACKGDPELPLDRDEMVAKSRDLLGFAAVNDVDAVIEGVLGMADGGDIPSIPLR